MKSFKMVTESAKKYIGNKLSQNVQYLQECEKAAHYNEELKETKALAAKELYVNGVYRLKDSYLDTKTAANHLIKDFLEKKFTMELTQDDIATLDNLSKISISASELRLQFEKYKDHPLALRRIQTIAEKQNFSLSDFGKEFSTNLFDYDYYMQKYTELERYCDQCISEVDSINPLSPMDQGKEIIVRLTLEGLDKQKEKMEAVFSPLTGDTDV